MHKNDMQRVHEIIASIGDEFWNECLDHMDQDPKEEDIVREGDNIYPVEWNGFLFDEVVELLNKKGLDLRLIHKKP